MTSRQLIRMHRFGRVDSASNNQARATCQSRSAVASEMLSTSPASFNDNPPKNRNSAIRLLRASKDGETVERGVEIEDVDVDGLSDGESGSSVTRESRPDRLAVRFARAWSTRTAAHHFGGHAKELRAVPPDDPALIDEAKEGLVNERVGCSV